MIQFFGSGVSFFYERTKGRFGTMLAKYLANNPNLIVCSIAPGKHLKKKGYWVVFK